MHGGYILGPDTSYVEPAKDYVDLYFCIGYIMLIGTGNINSEQIDKLFAEYKLLVYLKASVATVKTYTLRSDI